MDTQVSQVLCVWLLNEARPPQKALDGIFAGVKMNKINTLVYGRHQWFCTILLYGSMSSWWRLARYRPVPGWWRSFNWRSQCEIWKVKMENEDIFYVRNEKCNLSAIMFWEIIFFCRQRHKETQCATISHEICDRKLTGDSVSKISKIIFRIFIMCLFWSNRLRNPPSVLHQSSLGRIGVVVCTLPRLNICICDDGHLVFSIKTCIFMIIWCS